MVSNHRKNIFSFIFIFVSLFATLSTIYYWKEIRHPKAYIDDPLSFPASHAPHPEFDAEWWYVNMNLTLVDSSAKTSKHSHIISLSRILGNDGLLNTHYNHKTNSFVEKTHIGETEINPVSLGVGFEFNSQTASGSIYPYDKVGSTYYFKLEGQTPEIPNFNLDLEIPKFDSPLLWNCSGRLSVFRPNDTYYYSVPNIKVLSGTITYPDGKIYRVKSGVAWMDHQWFNGGPTPDWQGHYWISSKLGSNMSLGFVTQKFQSGYANTYWVMRRNGKNLCGNTGSVNITESWNNGYPKEIELTIDDNSSLVITNSSENQIIRPPIGAEFYEPSVFSIEGKVFGKPILTKYGFFETHLKN